MNNPFNIALFEIEMCNYYLKQFTSFNSNFYENQRI